jgi:radical SAM protein with 4Fe4S-binding SPASM domain
MTRGCLAGTNVCFVSHKGDVYPCGYLPVSAGSVRETRFADIWRHARVFQELRNPEAFGGKCGECRYIAICGGCRARAYGVGGDYMAEEPFCVYEPSADV